MVRELDGNPPDYIAKDGRRYVPIVRSDPSVSACEGCCFKADVPAPCGS